MRKKKNQNKRVRNVRGQFCGSNSPCLDVIDESGGVDQPHDETSNVSNGSSHQMDTGLNNSRNGSEYRVDANFEKSSRSVSELIEDVLHDTRELTGVQFSNNALRCEKCLRESTEFLPLELQQVSLNRQRHKKKFGAPLPNRNSAFLCADCRAYMQNSSRQLKWSFTWAVVFCTLLFYGSALDCNGEYFFNLLPTSIAYSWLSAALEANFEIEMGVPLFSDFSVIYSAFSALVEDKKA